MIYIKTIFGGLGSGIVVAVLSLIAGLFAKKSKENSNYEQEQLRKSFERVKEAHKREAVIDASSDADNRKWLRKNASRD